MSIGAAIGLLHGIKGGYELVDGMRKPDENGQIAPRRNILDWLGLRDQPEVKQQGVAPAPAAVEGVQQTVAPVRQITVGQNGDVQSMRPAVRQVAIPTPPTMQQPIKLTNDVAAAIAAAETSGLPKGYLERLAMIESAGGTQLENPSGARGPYQFMPTTAASYGLKDPMDPVASTDAVIRFTGDNREALGKALGRYPTAGELYLAHQQGAGGAAKLLAKPDALAADIVGKQAVVQNGGRADMTAGEFAAMWTGKFDRPGARSNGVAKALRDVREGR